MAGGRTPQRVLFFCKKKKKKMGICFGSPSSSKLAHASSSQFYGKDLIFFVLLASWELCFGYLNMLKRSCILLFEPRFLWAILF